DGRRAAMNARSRGSCCVVAIVGGCVVDDNEAHDENERGDRGGGHGALAAMTSHSTVHVGQEIVGVGRFASQRHESGGHALFELICHAPPPRASSSSRNRARPRKTCDFTVPTLTPSTAAVSASDNPS